MAEVVSAIPLLNVGAGGLLALWVLLVMLGKIPSPAAYRDVLADRDHYREASDRWQEVALKQGVTLERLLSLAETSAYALTEIQSGLGRVDRQ